MNRQLNRLALVAIVLLAGLLLVSHRANSANQISMEGRP